jgi:hypothetical protein
MTISIVTSKIKTHDIRLLSFKMSELFLKSLRLMLPSFRFQHCKISDTLPVGSCILRSVDSTLTVNGSTLTINSYTLTIDHRLRRLLRTIDQKWIASCVFNQDSEFCTHANTENEPCVSVYCILYFSTLMDPIC